MNKAQKRPTMTKVLSMILALIMVLSLLPLSGFTASDNSFTLSASSRFYIISDVEPEKQLSGFVQLIDSEFAAKCLPSTSVLPIVYGADSDVADGDIVIKIDSSLKSQSYKLEIAADKITVSGGDASGAYYGLIELLQMFEKNKTLEVQTVENSPLVSERSAYIDCGRVYFSPDMLKAMIKTLAWNKMNTLYLDFSNNNATRFFLDEMKVTVSGTEYDITGAKPSDNKYITQKQMEDIIDVADQYGVQIIPTFNSPGHIGGLRSLNGDFFDTGLANDYDRDCGKITLKIEDADAYSFGQSVVKLYVDFFADQGCKSFNIAADEATLGNVKYDSNNETFVNYVNALNAYIKHKGMVTRMFCDGVKSTGAVDKGIVILYWQSQSPSAQDFADKDYEVVNLSANAGLYFAYVGNRSSWWVWNQQASQIYSYWNPSVTSRDCDNQYTYTVKETVKTEDLRGAAFALWTDYAFVDNKTGDDIINSNNNNIMEKIQLVGERCWTISSSDNYSTWKSGLTTAPGGIDVSSYSIDTTVLPAAAQIVAASETPVPEPTETIDPEAKDIFVAVNGTESVTVSGKVGTEGTFNVGDGTYATYTVKHNPKVTGGKATQATAITDGKEYIIGNGSQYLKLNGDEVSTTKTTTDATKWTITGDSSNGYTIKSDNSYLTYTALWNGYSLSVGADPVIWQWSENNGFYFSISDYWGTTNYYLTYSSRNGWTLSSYASSNAQPYTVSEDKDETTTITFRGIRETTEPVSVIVDGVIYNITVSGKAIVEGNTIEIPISFVDYRADGILFEFGLGSKADGMGYQLVHTGSETSSTISGTTLTSLTPKDNAAGRTHTTWSNTNAYDAGNYIRTGMVEDELGANGMPVYKDSVVKHVASLLSAGNYNSGLRSSETATKWNNVLADEFLGSSSRSVLNTDATGFSEAFANAKTYDNISNAYDLAWYLLNTLYIGDSNMTTVNDTTMPIYGMADSTYNKLILREGSDGSYYMKAYTDGDKIKYDAENHAIYNSGENNSNTSKFFYPLSKLGYDEILGDTTDTTKTDGDSSYPANPNGNFTLRGEAQFVYNSSDNLYFTFTGDDDVYLFINNKLVLDLGGAHWSVEKTVSLNDVASECGLSDGQIATFAFFYMERFSDCSNFGIKTNIKLAERDIDVQKVAYDSNYSRQIADGGIVATGTTIAYDLVVTNKGNAKMSNIKLNDTDSFGGSARIGSGVTDVAVTAGTKTDSGLVSLGTGNTFVIYVTNANGADVSDQRQSFTTLEALSNAIADVTLEANQSLHVRFLTATTDVNASKMLSYSNKIEVTAKSGEIELKDSDVHTIYSYNANDTTKTYVIDFGLPVKIENIFDASSAEYIQTVNNVSQQPKYGKEITLQGNGFNTYFTYQLKDNTTIDDKDIINLSVTYKLGNATVNLTKTINIIPASNVYYEDSFAKFENGTSTGGNAAWSVEGKEDTGKTQLLEQLENKQNVYGYDTAYNDSTTYSMGSAHKVTVSADMANDKNVVWPTATFTFKGTGFDIISLTDNNSGAIYVDVYQGAAASGTPVKRLVVNNYYGYEYNNGQWTASPSDSSNALYQIPVMKVTGLGYDQWTVVVKVIYAKGQDAVNADQYSFWLDAIRVYNPMGEYADYTKDNEGYAQYIKLHNEIVKSNVDVDKTNLLFIEGLENADVATYTNRGPNNEVYLAQDQSISFSLTGNLSDIASVQIGAKAPMGETALVVNGNVIDCKGDGTKALISATEMYYDITSSARDGKQITITNNGSNILSLTNLKITYGESGKTVSLAPITADEQPAMIAAVRALFTAPTPEVKTFEPERFEPSWNSVRVGQKATLTVKTSTDVEAITVNGETVDNYKTRYERSGWGWWAEKVEYRVFTYTVTATETMDYEVAAVNAEGTASEPVFCTLTVKPAQTNWWDDIWNGFFGKWF